MIRLTILASALLLLTAFPSFADQVQLKNGDRLTGRFASLSGGTLTWRPAAGGELKINWADVVTIDIDDPVYVTLNGMPPILTGVSASTSPGRVELMPGGPVNLTDIIAISYGRGGGGGGAAATAPVVSTITGGAGAGVITTSGNTKLNSLRLNGDADARMGANRFVANGLVTHSKDNDIETARNWSLSGRYDRYLTSWLYAEANAVLTNDRFRDIDLRSAYGAGLGLQLLNTPRIKVSGAGGIGEVKQNFRSIPDFKLPGCVRLRVDQDRSHPRSRTALSHRRWLLPGLKGRPDVRAHAERAALRTGRGIRRDVRIRLGLRPPSVTATQHGRHDVGADAGISILGADLKVGPYV